MTFLLDIMLPVLVIYAMTVVGMDLRFEDFVRVREYPLLVPGIVVGQWIALLLVAGFLGRLLDLPRPVAGGALVLAAAPVAALSNYYAQLARGHLALAVTVTAVSNVLAVLATPLVATAGFRLFVGADAAFDLPPGRVAQQTFAGLLLPLLAGMFVRHRAPAWSLRWRAAFQMLGLLAIVAILAFVVVDQFAAISSQFGVFLRASIAFTTSMLGIGFIVTRAVVRPVADRRALLWSFPARNVAVAALIASAVIGQREMASFIAVLFAAQVAIVVPFAMWLNRRDARQRPA